MSSSLKSVAFASTCSLVLACSSAAPRATVADAVEREPQSHDGTEALPPSVRHEPHTQGGTEELLQPATATTSVEPPTPPGMVLVPGGTFVIGADDREPNQSPAHTVTVSPYFIDRTEVTVAEYAQCVQTGGCTLPVGRWCVYHSPSGEVPDQDRQAVTCVSWEQARAYCALRSARLPTEAEWEFAARGTDGRRYPWGDQPPRQGLLQMDIGSYCEEGDEGGCGSSNEDPPDPPVGAFLAGASPFGVLDMAGSAWEWVADWYAPYSPEPSVDPIGPSSGTARVARGGSDGGLAEWLESTMRLAVAPAGENNISFRCARSATPGVDR